MVEKNKQEQSLEKSSSDNIGALLFKRNDSFWFVAWLATIVSGAVYAASHNLLAFQMTEAMTILLIGGILIGVCAIPILLTIGIATWALWLTRFRIFTASLGGGMSCAVAAVIYLNISATYLSDGWKLIAGEALCGTIGCWLVLYLFGWRMTFHDKKAAETKAPWQFTMKDLFVHFTVLAVLISFWSIFLPYFWHFIASHHGK